MKIKQKGTERSTSFTFLGKGYNLTGWKADLIYMIVLLFTIIISPFFLVISLILNALSYILPKKIKSKIFTKYAIHKIDDKKELSVDGLGVKLIINLI